MRPSTLLFALFRFLIPPALIATTYLYLYPIAHGCAFPEAKPAEAACILPGQQQKAYVSSEIAPFRLLALGDPQLEGDTSLPNPNGAAFPSLSWERLGKGGWDGFKEVAEELVKQDVVRLLQGWRKRLDLWGNDLYLAHIYRSVSWWTQPTHTVVLGDLLGSQWIGDEEFARRTGRFWERVFKGGKKVPRGVMDVDGRREVLGKDEGWKRRIIAVAGNHDVGYAGDIHERRIERFEDAFGGVNWDVRFRLGGNVTNTTSSSATGSDTTSSPLENQNPELHLIILNSMNLDDPAFRPTLQKDSRDFLDAQLHPSTPDSPSTGTILLTHIPFHKEAGVCVDAPYFSHFPQDQGGGIREQNHLSKGVTDHILNGLTRPGTGNAVVLNGHDHEGCDTVHYRDTSGSGSDDDPPSSWEANHTLLSTPSPFSKSVREITVRSMMGSFAGNAGLLSAWFDHETQEWRFEYDVCVLGVQHIWWAVHVLDLIVLGLGLGSLLAEIVEAFVVDEDNGRKSSGDGKVKKA